MGKGSKRRPTKIPQELDDLNWAIILCKDEKQKEELKARRDEVRRKLKCNS